MFLLESAERKRREGRRRRNREKQDILFFREARFFWRGFYQSCFSLLTLKP